jgi:hypothetical protein
MTPPRNCLVLEVEMPLPPGAAPRENTPLKLALCAETPPATSPSAPCGLAIETIGVGTVLASPASPPAPIPEPPVESEPPFESDPPFELELPAVALDPALPPEPVEFELELPQAKTQAALINAKPKAIRIATSETYRQRAVNGRSG